MRHPLRLMSSRAHPGHRQDRHHGRACTPKLLLRHGTCDFKRKFPADGAHGQSEFPSGQLWRSPGAGLPTQARVLPAVEVTEFGLRLAQLRREVAHRRARE